MEKVNDDNRIVTLPVGILHNGSIVKEVELLRTNGVAEKVFTQKLPDNPQTWIANVLTVAIKDIGGTPIGVSAREGYLKSSGSLTIPNAIKEISLADTNTLLVEIHRKAWQNLLRRQEVPCKHCGEVMLVDIDLNKIEYDEDSKKKIEEIVDYPSMKADLPYGFTFESQGRGDVKLFEEYSGMVFNRFTFRPPTLGDSIRNEKYVSDNVMYWRRLAFDCLESVERVEEDGTVSNELPLQAVRNLGLNLFDLYLDASDLRAIRETLRETLPTMPFYYEDNCPNCKRVTPVTIESGSFFSA